MPNPNAEYTAANGTCAERHGMPFDFWAAESAIASDTWAAFKGYNCWRGNVSWTDRVGSGEISVELRAPTCATCNSSTPLQVQDRVYELFLHHADATHGLGSLEQVWVICLCHECTILFEPCIQGSYQCPQERCYYANDNFKILPNSVHVYGGNNLIKVPPLLLLLLFLLLGPPPKNEYLPICVISPEPFFASKSSLKSI